MIKRSGKTFCLRISGIDILKALSRFLVAITQSYDISNSFQEQNAPDLVTSSFGALGRDVERTTGRVKMIICGHQAQLLGAPAP
jgi:hypothetical protein